MSRMISRFRRGLLCLVATILVGSGCHDHGQSDVLQHACSYLWSQQGEDGGWHSSTHGILQGGVALTPFITWHLMQAVSGTNQPPRGSLQRALDFIRQTLEDEEGQPLVLEYPNYAAAYALRVMHHYGVPADTQYVHQLQGYLIKQQFTRQRGIDEDHPAFGGWGFGETGLPPGQAGHVDISHTRRILQALSDVLPAEHPVFTHAMIYLQRHQNFVSAGHPGNHHDGGFFTSMHTAYTNKSRQYATDPPRWESYATATADGLLGWLALRRTHDARVQAAVNWLEEHDAISHVEGIPEEDPAQWHLVMRYYHLAVRSEALSAVGCRGPWCLQVKQLLTNEQLPDGSFVNPLGAPNKEDDPLLATTLAVVALQQLSVPP
ncbi:MAG: hypothetical protein R3330_03160 [Saprospiraceae bacterium]|nr:hypothetical protein [Saprospiraceae bacterium]